MAGGTPPALRVLTVVGFGPVVFALCKLQAFNQKTFEQVLLNVVVSFLGFLLTKRLIPILKPVCLRRGLFGKDINKKGATSLSSSCMCCHWEAIYLQNGHVLTCIVPLIRLLTSAGCVQGL